MDQDIPQQVGLRERIAAALPVAMKARDQAAVAALRSTLAALANAEAVGVGAAPQQPTESADVAGSALGVGTTEAVRRSLADREVADLVLREATDREEAALVYDASGATARAGRLRAEASTIRAFLS